MTSCEAPTDQLLHPALRRRFSPVRFQPDAVLTKQQVETLIEAARRAPSAGNSQPWRFIVGKRGGSVHARILPHLGRSAAQWVPDASLLVVNLAQIEVADAPGWEYSEFAHYDLGQAVAHMTIQGLALGLDAHQIRAFDRQAVAEEFDVPAHWQVTSMTAFGIAAHRPGQIASAGTSRERLSPEDLVWSRDP
ncbi:nitroreductase family protein [Glutamicibacter sp. PS]|uniref:nitroreductase family protein n=1 Tax=Glutamicibacter sp. PS TaxID=3075634 RepID=UPI00284044F5|nr:nitroreductase family protein [Glutamicibacter sp. PS]MDR4534093.1 nitroreductase family protein [Glutamicibacter sp. PS]